MAVQIDPHLTANSLRPQLTQLWELSAAKIHNLHRSWDPTQGAPVFTRKGRYTTRGWTEWTQGFQFGSALLQFDATGDRAFLQLGREGTRRFMSSHISHVGVHDHGFNNISTYGHLLRLTHEGRIPASEGERDFYELALKASGAIQAARWTPTRDGGGFIYSFNGPHSLFIDTLRSLRSLAVAHQLGQVLLGEHDRKISLLERLLQHAQTTARYSVYYGTGRDAYDLRGRVAHESLFNIVDGSYRCPGSQQGYSPFTTWTRGLAWAICGFAEQLEWLRTQTAAELRPLGGRRRWESLMLAAAKATADFYLAHTPTCGVPYWDTGAPQLARLGDYLDRPADPYNEWEPVDSSAAAIAAQGLLRLGNYLAHHAQTSAGRRYRQAALTIARTLLAEPYLARNPRHQGLLLHSIYHRPNGWDYIPPGQHVPHGESSLWGDYHLREFALLLWREARDDRYPTFFSP